ncbi:MAG: hypothetical protein RQM90_02365 [Methanoculleus sp.]
MSFLRYAIDGDRRYRLEDDGRRGCAGTIYLRSRVTGEEIHYDLVVLFAGMDRIFIGVRKPSGDGALRAAWEEVVEERGSSTGTFSRIYTASDLMDEERWAVTRRILPDVRETESAVSRDAEALVQVIEDLGILEPAFITRLLEHARNEQLCVIFREGCPDPDRFLTLVEEMRADNLRFDLADLGEAASRRIALSTGEAIARLGDPAPLEEIVRIARCAEVFPLELSLWESQNVVIGMRGYYRDMHQRADEGDEDAERWTAAFREAVAHLGVRVT